MQVLQGKYQLVSPVASGGMATVYLGKVVGLAGFERLVAIKRMHPHLQKEADYVDMFLDEARLAARIRHPNVVATIDVSETEEGPFIVMEFIEGPTLSQLLKATRRGGEHLPLPVVLRVFDDVLAGLHAAHELRGQDKQPLNLVHRDVSPQNIMVGHDGVTRITDFGVARARVRLSSTRSGELKGKLAYLPPEQVRGDEIDRRADIYAAGVVLWEALTNKRLFTAKSDAHLMYKLIDGPGAAPRDINPDVPAAIDAVCMKALAPEPEDRYPTASDFARALEVAAGEAGIAIATSRAVAELAQALGIELPTTSEPPPGSTSSDALRSAHGRGASGKTGRRGANDLTRAEAPEPASGATAAGIATLTTPPQAPRRSGLALAAIVVFAAGAGAAVLLTRANPTATPTSVAPATVATTTDIASNGEASAPAASSPSALDTSSTAPSPQGSTSAAASPTPASSTSAAAPSTSSTASTTARVPAPPPRGARTQPAPTPTPPPPAPTGANADYQPEKL